MNNVCIFRAKLDTAFGIIYKKVKGKLSAMKAFMEKAAFAFVTCDYDQHVVTEIDDPDLTLDDFGNVVYQKFRDHYRYWSQIVWQSRCNAHIIKSKIKKRYVSENGSIFIETLYPGAIYRRPFTPDYSHKVVCLSATFDLKKKPGVHQLCFAIILEETGDPILAQKYYLKFADEVFYKFSWSLTEFICITFDEIHDWLRSQRG